MSIDIVGNRLVKYIGSGEKFRRIVTEVVDGKTFTKVMDGEDKVIVNRVKELSSQKVGDKTVRTVQKVTARPNELVRDTFDRVYKGNELVGRRATTELQNGDEFVKLTSAK